MWEKNSSDLLDCPKCGRRTKAGKPVCLETKVGDGEDTVPLDLLAGWKDLPDEQIEIDCMRGDLHF